MFASLSRSVGKLWGSSVSSPCRSPPFLPLGSVGRNPGVACRSLSGSTNSGPKSFYDDTSEVWANKSAKPLSLKSLEEFGDHSKLDHQRLLASARFVHKELPIRLSKELRNLEILPYIVMTNPSIRQIYDIYSEAFRSLLEFPRIRTAEDNEKFVELLGELVGDTVNVIDLLGKGVRETVARVPSHMLNIQDFLDSFLTSRIGRRVIAEQHIRLHMTYHGVIEHSKEVGVINPSCSPRIILKEVKTIVEDICRETFGMSPELVIEGNVDATVPMVIHHLKYILLEILKNSYRATVEFQRASTGLHFPDLPPVVVMMTEGKHFVTIKISDRGGGIPHETKDNIFTYGFTTASISTDHEQGLGMLGTSANDLNSPMAGIGFGLPLAKLYATHYGGNLDLISMEGYGCDTYIQIEKTGTVLEKSFFE